MALSNTAQLGQVIGQIASEQEVIKENISPEETSGDDQFFMFENIKINVTVTATKYVYPTDSFIIDHPVYGDIDSAVLLIDGGYDTGDAENGSVLETQSF